MKKVEAYKCDHCPKTSTNSGAMGLHERKCRHNPNNKHKCFEMCRHLKMSRNGIMKDFMCEVTGEMMYSFKAEYRGFDFRLKGFKRMPLECEHYKCMTFEDWY